MEDIYGRLHVAADGQSLGEKGELSHAILRNTRSVQSNGMLVPCNPTSFESPVTQCGDVGAQLISHGKRKILAHYRKSSLRFWST